MGTAAHHIPLDTPPAFPRNRAQAMTRFSRILRCALLVLAGLCTGATEGGAERSASAAMAIASDSTAIGTLTAQIVASRALGGLGSRMSQGVRVRSSGPSVRANVDGSSGSTARHPPSGGPDGDVKPGPATPGSSDVPEAASSAARGATPEAPGVGGAATSRTFTSGSQVTEADVRAAMKGAPLASQQAGGVSLPRIQDYVQRLLDGESPPPIKVDAGIIVEGNHRYVAGRILGQETSAVPWNGGRPERTVSWDELRIDPDPWE